MILKTKQNDQSHFDVLPLDPGDTWKAMTALTSLGVDVDAALDYGAMLSLGTAVADGC